MRIATWVVLALLPACQLIVGNDEPNELVLESLVITGGLDQAFEPETRSYTSTPSYLDTVEVVARSPDPDAQIEVTSSLFPGDALAPTPNGTPHDVRVLAGDNIVTIKLTTPQGITSIYQVTITVPGARFSSPGRIPISGNPAIVKTADIDIDGTPDIVVCTNNGLFVFGGKERDQIASPGLAPCIDFAIGDIDEVGVDIVGVNGSGQGTIFFNSNAALPNPRFGPPQAIATPAQSYISVALGDVDGDGDNDVMLGDNQLDGMSDGIQRTVLGNGAGTFGPIVSQVAAGAKPVTTLLGDFDPDPGLDAMVLAAKGFAITLMEGAGDGTFAIDGGIQTSTMGNTTDARSLIRLVADTDPVADWALVHGDRNELAVIRNFAGDNTVAADLVHDIFPTEAGPTSVTAADLDGDTHEDLIVTCRNAGVGKVTIFYGDGNGAFKPVSFDSPSPISAAVADFNGDELPDLVVLSATSTEGVHVLLQEPK